MDGNQKVSIMIRGLTPEVLAKIDTYVAKYGGSRASYVQKALAKFMETDTDTLALDVKKVENDGT